MNATDDQPLIVRRVLAAFAGMLCVSLLDTLGLLPTQSSAMVAALYGILGAGGGYLMHESWRRHRDA